MRIIRSKQNSPGNMCKETCDRKLGTNKVPSYNDALLEHLLWITNIKHALENNGMLVYFINSYDSKPLFISRKIYVTVSDEFHQNAFQIIRNVRSKVNPYSIVKTEIGFESYVTKIKNTTKRGEMTKFRLSNHNLMI